MQFNISLFLKTVLIDYMEMLTNKKTKKFSPFLPSSKSVIKLFEYLEVRNIVRSQAIKLFLRPLYVFCIKKRNFPIIRLLGNVVYIAVNLKTWDTRASGIIHFKIFEPTLWGRTVFFLEILCALSHNSITCILTTEGSNLTVDIDRKLMFAIKQCSRGAWCNF